MEAIGRGPMSPSAMLALAIVLTPAQPIILKPPDPIAGIVVDEEDRPVEGFNVLLVGAVPVGKNDRCWRGRSTAAGRFEADQTGWFTSGQPPAQGYLELLAHRPGFRVARLKVDARSPTTRDRPSLLVLRRATGLTVRVIDPDGRPVAGAKVRVSSSVFQPIPDELGIPDATTDSEGRARFADLSPEDRVSFEVTSPDFGTQSVPYSSPAPVERTLALRAVGRLSGRVIADDVGGAKGILILGISGPTTPFDGWSTVSGRVRTTTGADGRFDVSHVAAGRFLFFTIDPAEDLILIRPRNQTLEAGDHIQVDFRLNRGIPAHGIVRERGTNRPIVGASFYVGSFPRDPALGGTAKEVRSDANDQFRAYLLPGQIWFLSRYSGDYVVPGDIPRAALSSDGFALTALPEGSAGIELPPIELVRSVDIRGVVLDEAGKPVVGAQVEGWMPDGAAVAGWSFFRPPLLTDARGEFVVKAVTPGVPLEWAASLGDSASAPPMPIMSDAANPIRLVISPKHAMSLAGRVLDEVGRGIAGAELIIRSRRRTASGRYAWQAPSESGDWHLRTDAEGRFRTPRQLRTDHAHIAEAKAIGKKVAATDWTDSSVDAFPDIVLVPLSMGPTRPNP